MPKQVRTVNTKKPFLIVKYYQFAKVIPLKMTKALKMSAFVPTSNTNRYHRHHA